MSKWVDRNDPHKPVFPTASSIVSEQVLCECMFFTGKCFVVGHICRDNTWIQTGTTKTIAVSRWKYIDEFND